MYSSKTTEEATLYLFPVVNREVQKNSFKYIDLLTEDERIVKKRMKLG